MDKNKEILLTLLKEAREREDIDEIQKIEAQLALLESPAESSQTSLKDASPTSLLGTDNILKKMRFGSLLNTKSPSLLLSSKEGLDNFNFGIKPQKPAAIGGGDNYAQSSDAYLNAVKKDQMLSTALEVGKMGANMAAYIRNEKTSPPAPLEAKSIPLISPNYMSADYSQIDQDLVRLIGGVRESGGGSGSINALLRTATDAKSKLGSSVNLANIQEKGRVDTVNTDITAKNTALKLDTERFNREADMKLGAMKSDAQRSLMQSVFDSATNVSKYRQQAGERQEEYRRYLNESALEWRKLAKQR